MGRKIDITGIRKGKLIAVKIHSQDKNKRFLWLCKCDCGGEKVLRLSTFRKGKITSCGCERMAHNRHNDRNFAIIKNLHNSHIKRKKDKGFKNTLPLSVFELLIFKNCFYCDSPPSQFIYDRYSKNKIISDKFIIVNGIDRIDSNKGYEEGNVRPCCKHCNTAKNTLSENQFKDLISKIYYNWIGSEISKEYCKIAEKQLKPYLTQTKMF